MIQQIDGHQCFADVRFSMYDEKNRTIMLYFPDLYVKLDDIEDISAGRYYTLLKVFGLTISDESSAGILSGSP